MCGVISADDNSRFWYGKYELWTVSYRKENAQHIEDLNLHRLGYKNTRSKPTISISH